MAKRQPIVVDGANVAYEEQSREGKPRLSNVVAMIALLESYGFEPIVLVDASLRHEIDDPVQLESLLDDQKVRQVPAGTDADYFVLTTAEEQQAQVVSNDTYRDFQDKFAWIRERRVPFMIVKDDVQLYEPKLRRQKAAARKQ